MHMYVYVLKICVYIYIYIYIYHTYIYIYICIYKKIIHILIERYIHIPYIYIHIDWWIHLQALCPGASLPWNSRLNDLVGSADGRSPGIVDLYECNIYIYRYYYMLLSYLIYYILYYILLYICVIMCNRCTHTHKVTLYVHVRSYDDLHDCGVLAQVVGSWGGAREGRGSLAP